METKVSNIFFRAILNCSEEHQTQIKRVILNGANYNCIKDIENQIEKLYKKSTKEIVENEFFIDKNFNRTKFSKENGISRQHVIRILNQLKNK